MPLPERVGKTLNEQIDVKDMFNLFKVTREASENLTNVMDNKETGNKCYLKMS